MTTKTLKSMLLPGGVLLLAVAGLEYLGWLTLAPPAIGFLCYCALLGGMLLAWRFHSSRIFFSLCVLFLSQQAIGLFSAQHSLGPGGLTAVRVLAVLVPLDYVLISLMQERGFTVASAVPVAIFLFIESVVVVVLCRSAEAVPALPLHSRHLATAPLLPTYALIIFGATGLFLLARFLLVRKPVDGALLWSLFAFFMSLRNAGAGHGFTLYLATAASILAVSIIENSYLLAYHDELTGVPSRRAFNDALLRLQEPYSIAVVDIDHFKKFNDTYGHDTGDQVLRLVAAKLAQVTGGGQAFRCGGEEFNILFSGKTTSEVVDHLEKLRLAIASAEFRTRGGDRRQEARGPDRRNVRTSRTRTKGEAIRQLAEEQPASSLSVTVSIGVATSAAGKSDPQDVLQSADKALYRAKANGRNRLETASPKRRSKARSAEIA